MTLSSGCCDGPTPGPDVPVGRATPDACCSHDAAPTRVDPPATAGPAATVWIAGALVASGAACGWLGLPMASTACYAAAILTAVREPARRAVRSVRSRVLDINVLMVVAVAGAMALGEWLEAATVVWLFALSQWIESLSMSRARRAIRSLMTLAPSEALVRGAGGEAVVPVAQLAIGDVVIVRPGERVPIDGVVLAGESAIDQSPVTGESWPAEKAAGDSVFAGSINGNGALDIRVTRPASDSTIARIIHMVERAQAQRAPVQAFVDRFARWYTPAVVVAALLVATAVPLLGGGAWGVWIYRALVLLVVACPCALVISTPVSIVSALTAAARQGVLIKGGAHLERLAAVRCVAFDKTGTLTDGRVSVTDVLGLEGVTSHGLLSVAAALEARSEHPIGRAIVSRAEAEGVLVAAGDRFRALPGRGAEAWIAAVPALVGSHRLFEERQLCTPALHARIDEVTGRGGTPVLVGSDGAALGVIGLRDRIRDGGRAAVSRLRRAGIAHTALLTGDTSSNAAAMVVAAGLDEGHAELLPEDKVSHVQRLRRLHGPVAMVGDGVNDAPALAAADVGIAMGAGGTDVALETADVALMSDDLDKVAYAVTLGRRTLKNIHVNIGIALGLKGAFVVLAALGAATLWMAVLADTGASLLVTANGLRLLRRTSS